MSFFNVRKKLLIIFMTITIIPIFIVTLSSYRSYTKLVNKQVSLVTSSTISNSAETIDNIFNNIDRITLTFQQFSVQTGSTTVADQLNQLDNKKHLDQYDLFVARNKMLFFFNNLILSNSYINGIYIFLPNGDSISYGKGTDLKVNYKPFNDNWYKQTLLKNGGLYVSNTNKKNFIIQSTPSITFSRVLYDTDSKKLLGVLMLDCGTDIFKELDNNIVPNVTEIYLVNGQGKILFDNDKSKIDRTIPHAMMTLISQNPDQIVQRNQNGILTVIKPLPDNDWKIVASISLNNLYKQYGVSKKLILYISITCALIFTLFSIILSNLVTRPIIQLSKIMNKNKFRTLVTTKDHLERSDEIGILFNQYNKMIRAIDEHIKESYQNKLISLDSQMKALEAQINSHFLYNTLESINSIAEMEEIDSISIMTKALGDMFRYSIKTESELVSVKEELTHVNNYLSIQKIRFEDKIDFQFDIQQNVYKLKILKLILQPIIENCFHHGLENVRRHGHIIIHAYETDHEILFEIVDDGIGIPANKLQEIKKLLNLPPQFNELGQRDKRSIGLKNVHSRIALYYGSKYGLTIESELNRGTTVKIRIPKIT